jgi:TonB family protein
MPFPDSPSDALVQRRPLIITLGIHALLLLVLLLWHFRLPAQQPAPQELGMEVNLGTSDDGSGYDQPMDVEDPAASATTARRASQSAASSADIERSDDEEAPAVPTAARASRGNGSQLNNQPSRSNSSSNADARRTQPQRPRYVYPGSNGRGGNAAAANMSGTSEGNTTGAGDRGVPRGTPGASNYEGSPGSGTGGVSFALSGRTMIAFPPKEAQFRNGGRVVVRITVARDGSITNRQIKSSTNSELNAIALRKAGQARFNADSHAPDEQFGEITFVFKTRQ